jgi:protocatechuate 3,4-dioxygenase beta subunit
MSKPELLRRREALAALGALGLAAAIPKLRSLGTTEDAEAASCVLMPELTEGPYWVRNNLTRRDITESRPGIPLALRFKVQDASTCTPIKGADVELWHADARGVYSGVNGASTHFLRGHQKSNADGVVRFDTMYPGWYRGRTPHIHVKVHVDGAVHTGQIFFPDAVSARVYRTKYYAAHGQADMTNAEDSIYAESGGRTTLRLRRRSGGGYRATLALGLS